MHLEVQQENNKTTEKYFFVLFYSSTKVFLHLQKEQLSRPFILFVVIIEIEMVLFVRSRYAWMHLVLRNQKDSVMGVIGIPKYCVVIFSSVFT